MRPCGKAAGTSPARYGGEEFAVIAPQVDAGRAGDLPGERIRAKDRGAASATDWLGTLTVSIGSAIFPREMPGIATLLSHADARACTRPSDSGRKPGGRFGLGPPLI